MHIFLSLWDLCLFEYMIFRTLGIDLWENLLNNIKVTSQIWSPYWEQMFLNSSTIGDDMV